MKKQPKMVDISKYFDSSATALPDKSIVAEMQKYMEYGWGNPSSLYGVGENAKDIINTTKKFFSKYFDCLAENIFFTSGATESNNWVLNNFFGKDDTIITHELEHDSVLSTIRNSKNNKAKNIILKTNADNFTFNIHELNAQIKKHSRKGKTLVVVSLVNGLTSVINPVDLIEKCSNTYILLDITQGVDIFPWCAPYLKQCDFITFSGHKIGALKGIGLLVQKNTTIELNPFIFGGHQENGYRAGTENILGIMTLKRAYTNCVKRSKKNAELFNKLNDYLVERLCNYFGNKIIICKSKGYSSSSRILSFWIKEINSENLAYALSNKGYAIATGTACTTGQDITTKSKKWSFLSKEYKNGYVRISFSDWHNIDDIDKFFQDFVDSYEVVISLQDFVDSYEIV